MERPSHAQTAPDITERGGPRDGQPQRMDRRLFMQLLVYGDCPDTLSTAQVLEQAGVQGAMYEDLHDPAGIGVLIMHEQPDYFVTRIRKLLSEEPFASMTLKPRYTLFGRTYSMGYEPDLEDALFGRPRRTALNPQWPWTVWYPLRRCGSFMTLAEEVKRDILMEHGAIGRAFGEANFAHDIRLACHGLDTNDNDFIVGLVGPELYPLSAIVQTMRRTKQTSQYIEHMGPFFIGRAAWQSRL
ncbi:MAG: chlorite dismutase family protein [Phycisphaeraceae bacterium]|nr:chlorite dismutase family protein [Phycisphaeraceae bacterium]